MSKNICVIGTGYVGLVVSIGLSDFGNYVIGVDNDSKKIDLLNRRKSPIYERGIDEYLSRNLKSGRLRFSKNINEGISSSEVVIIAVGTPPKQNGEANLSFIDSAIDSVVDNLCNYKVIVTKSTVPVGTNRQIKEKISKLSGKTAGIDFDVVSNPEFLREGKAVQDFFHPDRTVIGYESEKAKETMIDVYRALNLISVPFVWCGLETAELLKYASNAFLATKITFINQIANLAEAVGADINELAKSMGMDGRISSKFLHPGPGYGGSCFPKDTKAIVQTGVNCGVDMSLVRTVVEANEVQKERMVYKLARLFDKSFIKPEIPVSLAKLKKILNGKTIAVLGLAFKQETDDIRESPSIVLIKKLINAGVTVHAHDPKAMDNFSKLFPSIKRFETSYNAMEGADALVLMTEWNEYRSLDLKRAASKMRDLRILDARNLLDPHDAEKNGFVYDCVGRKINTN